MLILGNLLWTVTGAGFVPPPPPPAPEPSALKPSGGIPADQIRTRRDISRARKRFGLDDGADREVVAATVIADVAARQALVLERDAQKRFEELLRELELQGIEFDARYLEALNIQRERLIDAEIAARLRLLREDEELIILLLMAASVA